MNYYSGEGSLHSVMLLRAWFIDYLHPSAGGVGCLLKRTGTGLTSPESVSLEMIWPKLPFNKHLMILMQNELRSMLLIKTYKEIHIFFHSAVDMWRLRVPSPTGKACPLTGRAPDSPSCGREL